MIKAVDHASLRFLWDSANFIQVGEARVVERGWPLLKDFIGAVHIKDAVLADGHVVAAGEGDGQLPLLLSLLKEEGFQGFLTLEPHLKVAGHSTGFTGPELMAYAVKALRQVMADTGCVEVITSAWYFINECAPGSLPGAYFSVSCECLELFFFRNWQGESKSRALLNFSFNPYLLTVSFQGKLTERQTQSAAAPRVQTRNKLFK